MNGDFNSIDDACKAAGTTLAAIFTDIVLSDDCDFENVEQICLKMGHNIMADAFGKALENLDEKLCSCLPEGTHIKDRRNKTLVTTMGDVTFKQRRCIDEYGNSVYPLSDALNLGWGARISPAAFSFLIEAAAQVSYTKSAHLLEMAAGSSVSATTVMNAIHTIGKLCSDQDISAAKSLYMDGVLPEAEFENRDLCLESDGTYIKLQNQEPGKPNKVEIKASVAYAGKVKQGNKVTRQTPIRHGCVNSPEAFWLQSITTIGSRYDLSKLLHLHMGCDGEAMYKNGYRYLPGNIKCTTHLDKFHLDRKVMGVFFTENKDCAQNIMGTIYDGDIESAANLVDEAGRLGLAKNNYKEVSAYLRNNKEIIGVAGPSLGTMESEQQHVYGARMDSVPCAWSIRGVDAMARIRSRIASKRDLPKITRKDTVTKKRERRCEVNMLSELAKQVDTNVPYSVGKGHEAEHKATLSNLSAKIRYAAGVDSGMVKVKW